MAQQPVKESLVRALGIEDLGIADLGIENSVLIYGAIEADRRLPLQHGLRFNLTKPAKPPPMAGRKQEVLQLRE